MSVKERVLQTSISVLESDFADDHETVVAWRRRTHPPKPQLRRFRRRKPAGR
jgi:hypothetical protein